MMKKLLLFSTALFAFAFGAHSQNSKSASRAPINLNTVPVNSSNVGLKVALTPTVVTDTLHYYYNKQLYKIPNATGLGFPYYKSPAATGTAVTHVGSVFLNTDSMFINGLECMAAFNTGSGTVHTAVRGRLYLCKVDNQNVPIVPAGIIDSVLFTVSGAHPSTTLTPKGFKLGGDFSVPRKVGGNFAVLVRNVETTEGDTIRILRTAGITPTNTVGNPAYKFGEGFGIVRKGGIVAKTTNYGLASFGFGVGTDYEFCVAPRVTYTLIPNHIAPASVQNQIANPTDSIACWEPLTFTNTSSPQLTSRFFNLNQFYLKWAPFSSTPPGNFSADSAVSWSFDDEDGDNSHLRPDIYLHYGSSSATKYYDTSSCFNNCKFKTRLRKMAAESGASMVYFSDSTFKICVKSCGPVGINERNLLSNLTIYPNPTSFGKTTISGLVGKNTIFVYNMVGQLVATEITDKESTVVDLFKQPQGTYLIRVINSENKTKITKIVNQKE